VEKGVFAAQGGTGGRCAGFLKKNGGGRIFDAYKSKQAKQGKGKEVEMGT